LLKIGRYNYRELWGDMIRYFIKFLEECESWNIKMPDVKEIPEHKRNAYRTLSVSINLINSFLEYYGLSLNECLGLSKDYNELLYDFFIRKSADISTVELLKDTISDLADSNVLTVKYTVKLPEKYDKLNNTLIIIEDKIMFTEECMKEIILSAMNTDISCEKILNYLKGCDYIITNDCSRCRKTIYIGKEKFYKGFIALRKEHFEINAVKAADTIKNENTSDNKKENFETWLR